MRSIAKAHALPTCTLISLHIFWYKVNGQDVRSIPGHVLQNMLLGPLGSTIEISFRPHSSAQIQVITLQVLYVVHSLTSFAGVRSFRPLFAFLVVCFA
jgi:hypothetical protein